MNGSTQPDPSNYLLGRPALDAAGNIYVESAVSLHSFGPDGAKRWSWSLPGQSSSSEPQPGMFCPTVVAAVEILGQSLGHQTAVAVGGSQVWDVTTLSVAKTVGHWGLGFDETAAYALDLRTGKPAGRLRAKNGHDVIPIVPLSTGIVVVERDNSEGLQVVRLDTCGNEQSRLAVGDSKLCFTPDDAVVGPGEVTYLPIDACGDATPDPRIVAIDSSGRMVGQIATLPQRPLLVGADGTVYGVENDAPVAATNLVAFSPDLHEQWRVPLNGSVPLFSSGALADDGVLYLQVVTTSGNTVVAIQTTSPGLAHTPWPSNRADNRGSNWAAGQY